MKGLLQLPVLSQKIMEAVSKHTKVDMNLLLSETEANRSAIKRHLAKLTSEGFLHQYGKGRATFYVARRAMD